MRALRAWRVVWVALLLVLLAPSGWTGAAQTATARGGIVPTAAPMSAAGATGAVSPPGGFVRRDGSRLALADGATYRIRGVNYYPRDHAWSIFSEWNPKQVTYELGVASQLGVNTIRTFVPVSAFGGAAANWQQQAAFREFLALCAERRIRVVVGLFDSYRKWPAAGWDAWPAPDTAAIAPDEAYLRAIIRPYANDPTILAWDVYNEADWVTNDEWMWDAHAEQRLRWVQRMVNIIRADAPNHLAMVGTIFPASTTVRRADLPTLAEMTDIVSIHYYAHAFPGSSLAEQFVLARQTTDKPLLAGEIGFSSFGNKEAEQGAFLAAALTDAKNSDAAGAMVWTLVDFAKVGTGPEAEFGLLRTNYTMKPAAQVFAAFAYS